MKKISVKIDRLEEKDLERVMEIWLHTNQTAHSFVPADYWKSHYEELFQKQRFMWRALRKTGRKKFLVS